MAAHMDGSIIVYDKEKEDAIFSREDEESPHENDENGEADEVKKNGVNGHSATDMEIWKSVHSKNQKFNPVAYWKLSNQRINAFAISPDNRHLATVSEDGTLRIIDYLKEECVAPIIPTSFSWTRLTLRPGAWTCTMPTTADLSASAGLPTADTSSPEAKTISSRSGQWRIRR